MYDRLLAERLAAVEATSDEGQHLSGRHYAQLFVVAAVIPAVLLFVAWWV